jgi:serine/threonine protein kinase/tetratricopeptide (TPR) repeat protein
VTDEERAAEIVADIRERGEGGERIDTDEVLREHPDLVGPLRRAFDATHRLEEEYLDTRPAPSRVGCTLGPYRLDAEIGAGGMGTVYLATLAAPAAGLDAGARVAVKVLHPHVSVRRDAVQRFLREARIGSTVRHENVVRTLDALQLEEGSERLHLVVLEHVEGRTLRALLDELGRLPEELCRHVGREAAKALVAIHKAGVIHRDVKPENVLVTAEQVVKLADLGVARLLDESLRVSQTGAFVGSVRYAAPEQFGRAGDEVDGRADLYALGLTLYELATGAHPFAGDELHLVLRKQMSEVPRPVGEVNPQLSPFFEELVARLVEKDRTRRIASAADVLRILEEGEESAWWRERSLAIRDATRCPLRRIRIPRETAVYGRDAEIAKLQSLFDKTKAGDGQVVLVEGEAGIGKSRLVDEFVGRLAQAGEDVNFLYGSYPPGGAATASGAFTSAYREQLGDDEASIRAALPQTPLLVPAFAALLSGDVAPKGAEALTKDSLQTVFVHATRAFAAERPTIVLIDDLHFAPDEGRALFASLALAVPGNRILLLGTARPEIDAGWIAQIDRIDHVSRIRLPRLGAKDLVLLLRDSLRSEHLAEELGAKIAVKSDGNPFFVFEILRGLRDGQFLTRKEDGTWATTKLIAEIEVPETVKDLIFARVGSLSTVERNLLDVAACAGFDFDPVLVGEVLRVGRIPVLQRLAAVEKSQRLVRSVGRRFVFDHHQIAEVLYAALPEILREEYHAAIGAAIEARSGAASKEPMDIEGALCVDLAEHYLKGAQGPRALRYLDAALTHLEKAYLNDAAVRLTDRALAVPGLVAGRERCELLLRKAGRLDLLGRRDAQRAALEEANTLADADGDAALRTRALRSLGVFHHRISGNDEARTVLGESLAMARAAGDRKEEAVATGNLGQVFLQLGRIGEAREHYERWLALSREIGDRRGEASAMGSLGSAFRHLGRLVEARQHLERGLSLAREIGNRQDEASAMGNLGIVLRMHGRLAEAREHFERHLALSREIGNRHIEAIATGNLGNVFSSLGRLGEAREHHERHFALSREVGYRWGEVIAMANLQDVFIALGCFGEAREHSKRSLALSREIGSRLGEGLALQFLADVSAEEGDAAAAERSYTEALALRREIGFRDGEAETLVARGAHLARQGREAEARADLGAAIAIARELSLPGVELLATAQLATLPGGAPRDRPQDGPVSPGAMVAAALTSLAAHEGHAEIQEAMEARFLLWQATRDPAHLAEAGRLLDFMVEHAPPECRETMLANVRLHREIAAAAREEGLPLAADSSRAGDGRSAGSADG